MSWKTKIKIDLIVTLMIVLDLEFQQETTSQRNQTNGAKTSIRVLNDFSKINLPTIAYQFL